MKLSVNKEIVSKGFNIGKKLGKAILWEGVKGVLLKSTANVITTSFEKGLDGVKKMTIDDYVGSKKAKHITVVPETKSETKEEDVIIDAEFVVVNERKQD